MSRQQAYAEELLRSQHDKLVAELRLRQRNIVFPDTVRNLGIFYRNLASGSIHVYVSHRIFAAFWGLYLLTQFLVFPVVFRWQLLMMLRSLILSLPSIAAGLKITVNAIVREEEPKLPLSKVYPRIKI